VGAVRPFLPGLLELQLVHNSGAAFSLFSGSSGALGLVSLLVSAALLAWTLLAPPRGIWLTLAVGFLLGGAAGNGIRQHRFDEGGVDRIGLVLADRTVLAQEISQIGGGHADKYRRPRRCLTRRPALP
jgi:lipoprotein signal peptidase